MVIKIRPVKALQDHSINIKAIHCEVYNRLRLSSKIFLLGFTDLSLGCPSFHETRRAIIKCN